MKTIPLLLALLLGSIRAAPQDPDTEEAFLFVGHRGASYLAPENTLASMRLAWELGADAAECDVMLTRDNRIIVFHDLSAKKLTGHDHTIKETDWEVLAKLSVKPRDTNLPGYPAQSIPLLEELLEVIPSDRMLVIEIKTGPEILPYLKQVVDTHWKTGMIRFISFDFETIKTVKSIYPEIPCYYLSMFKADLRKQMDDIVESGLDGVDLRDGMIDRKLVERCHASGLDVWCWTVNDPETARKMREMGVSAVTTDRPAWLKENM